MPTLTNGGVSTNGLDMLTEIRRERTVELAFEGFRRDDLRRWKTAETEMPQALRGVKFVGTEFEQRDSTLVIGTDIQVDGAASLSPSRPREGNSSRSTTLTRFPCSRFNYHTARSPKTRAGDAQDSGSLLSLVSDHRRRLRAGWSPARTP